MTLSMLAVPKRRLVYHRGRADLTWRKLDLTKLDFAPKRPSEAPRKHARVASASFYAIDVTSYLVD